MVGRRRQIVVRVAPRLPVARGVLARMVVDDLQDLDEPERGSQPTEGRLLIRVDVRHIAMMAIVAITARAKERRTERTPSLSVVMGWWPTPAHENVAWSPGDVGFAWCS